MNKSEIESLVLNVRSDINQCVLDANANRKEGEPPAEMVVPIETVNHLLAVLTAALLKMPDDPKGDGFYGALDDLGARCFARLYKGTCTVVYWKEANPKAALRNTLTLGKDISFPEVRT